MLHPLSHQAQTSLSHSFPRGCDIHITKGELLTSSRRQRGSTGGDPHPSLFLGLQRLQKSPLGRASWMLHSSGVCSQRGRDLDRPGCLFPQQGYPHDPTCLSSKRRWCRLIWKPGPDLEPTGPASLNSISFQRNSLPLPGLPWVLGEPSSLLLLLPTSSCPRVPTSLRSVPLSPCYCSCLA